MNNRIRPKPFFLLFFLLASLKLCSQHFHAGFRLDLPSNQQINYGDTDQDFYFSTGAVGELRSTPIKDNDYISPDQFLFNITAQYDFKNYFFIVTDISFSAVEVGNYYRYTHTERSGNTLIDQEYRTLLRYSSVGIIGGVRIIRKKIVGLSIIAGISNQFIIQFRDQYKSVLANDFSDYDPTGEFSEFHAWNIRENIHGYNNHHLRGKIGMRMDFYNIYASITYNRSINEISYNGKYNGNQRLLISIGLNLFSITIKQ